MKTAKSKIIISAVCLVLAVALAVTVCFAWFAFTTTSKINPWEASTSDAKVKITIYKLDSKSSVTDETTKETTVTYTTKMEELPNSPEQAMKGYNDTLSSGITAVLLKLEYEVADGTTYAISLNRLKDETRGVKKNTDASLKVDFIGSLSFAIGIHGAGQPEVDSVNTDGKTIYKIKEAGVVTTNSTTDPNYDKKILVDSSNSTVEGTPKVVYFIMDYNEVSLGNVFAVIAQLGGGLTSTIKFKNDMTVSISTGG